MAARQRCILLAGAPSVEDLRWCEDQLLADLKGPFRCMNSESVKAKHAALESSVLTPIAHMSKWRSISLDYGKDSRELDGDQDLPQTQFLSFHEGGSDKNRQREDFLEHSVAVFDDLVSSQILQSDLPAQETTIDFSTSLTATSITDSSFDRSNKSFRSDFAANNQNPIPNVGAIGPVSHLKQIPYSDYISSILPQTMTVNLIAGVITLSTARTVRLKKSNAEMDIIEVIVGDETRRGFTITFWLAPQESQSRPTDDLRGEIQKLRAGDVLLLRNIALSCFRSCVYGQSLSKRFAKNSTSITLLHDDAVSLLPLNLRTKQQRVQDWIAEFVGLEKKATSFPAGSSPQAAGALLPPDTQD